MSQKNIYNLSLAELAEWVAARGFKPYMVQQLVPWLYAQRVGSFDAMSNLAKSARAMLAEEFCLATPEQVAASCSEDGSVKLGFRLSDGAVIESVLMPQDGRITLCVSSQVGCAMGCVFCKTAEMKLVRHLAQHEILGQVLAAIRLCESDESVVLRLKQRSGRGHISNIVFMGMGEPLHNFGPVVESIRILLEQRAFNFANRKITVSTVGLLKEIVRFGQEVPARLAVSLNAPTDSLRRALMPIHGGYDLPQLMEACQQYARDHKTVVTFEYVLIKDVNDSLAMARDLVRLISHTPCKLNLIPFNEYPGSPYQRPAEERVLAFHKYLADRGFRVNIRYSKGLDAQAACGQLATDVKRRVA